MYGKETTIQQNATYRRAKRSALYQQVTTRLQDMTKTKIVSDYDQELPQSQTADNPVTPRGRAAQPSRDTRKTN